MSFLGTELGTQLYTVRYIWKAGLDIQTHTHTQIFHLLVHPADCHNSWDWPGHSYIWVSHMGGRAWVLGPSAAAFPGMLAGNWIRSAAPGLKLLLTCSASITDVTLTLSAMVPARCDAIHCSYGKLHTSREQSSLWLPFLGLHRPPAILRAWLCLGSGSQNRTKCCPKGYSFRIRGALGMRDSRDRSCYTFSPFIHNLLPSRLSIVLSKQKMSWALVSSVAFFSGEWAGGGYHYFIRIDKILDHLIKLSVHHLFPPRSGWVWLPIFSHMTGGFWLDRPPSRSLLGDNLTWVPPE